VIELEQLALAVAAGTESPSILKRLAEIEAKAGDAPRPSATSQRRGDWPGRPRVRLSVHAETADDCVVVLKVVS
jgi:hypothetical protein